MAITRRREQESKRDGMVAVVSANMKNTKVADWEIKSDARIRKNVIAMTAQKLEKQDKVKVLERRKRLTELLAHDDQVAVCGGGNVDLSSWFLTGICFCL